jgi:hypothetical protein
MPPAANATDAAMAAHPARQLAGGRRANGDAAAQFGARRLARQPFPYGAAQRLDASARPQARAVRKPPSNSNARAGSSSPSI